MDHMTSRERVLAVYQGTKPDRIPTYIQGLMVAREKLGYSAIEMVSD
jgi:hypothetical protein